MKEHDIRVALKKRVESLGGEVRAVSWLGRRNAPDVLCLFPNNHPVWVETKAPGGKPTEAQAREHARLQDAWCNVLVITTLEDLDYWLPPRA